MFNPKTLTSFLAASALAFGAVVSLSPTVNAADYDYTYYGYDTDNDGFLEETEYVGYSYDLIDYDDDDLINESEWSDYTSIWYEPYNDVDYTGTFTSYDLDGDGYIEYSEYETNYDSDLYTAWDIDNDGYIEDYEYNTAANMYVDYDNDGLYEW